MEEYDEMVAEAIGKMVEEEDRQSDLNEDGVPMNEWDACEKWRGELKAVGTFTGRIENIGTSLPDIFMIHKSVVVFQEAKVRRGNYVFAPQYQWSTMVVLSHEMHPWQLVYVVYNAGIFDLYEFRTVKRECEAKPASAFGKIKVRISDTVPFMSVADREGYEQYLDLVHQKAFKKVRRPIG